MPVADFHEVRLPDVVERGASGGPGFRTTVTVLSSGFEQRNRDWSLARATYDISYGANASKPTFDEVIAFFYARVGRLHGFRFKDWADYELLAEPIGVGNGSDTQFQAIRTYADAGGSYVRPIQKIVPGTSLISVDGIPIDASGIVASIDDNTGVVTFDVPPPSGAIIRLTCEFDVPVRFETDDIDVRLTWEEAGTVQNLGLVEVRLRLEPLNNA